VGGKMNTAYCNPPGHQSSEILAAQMASTTRQVPGLDRVSNINFKLCFQDLWPNPGPGLLPLDSGGGEAELAGIFASVALLAVSFGPEPIFWNPAEKIEK